MSSRADLKVAPAMNGTATGCPRLVAYSISEISWQNGKKAVLCAVFSVCIFANMQASSGQKFQWDLSVGDQFEVTFDQSTDTQTTVNEKTTKINSSTMLEMAWSVLEIDNDNNYLIEQSISSIRLSVADPALPAKSVALDTAENSPVAGESANILKQIKPLINLKFNIAMTTTGDITSVELPVDTAKVLQELPGSLQLQALFSEQGVKELFGAAAVVLPEDEIQVGHSWETSDSTQTAFGEFNRNRRYEFAENRPPGHQDSAHFRLKTTLDPANEASQENSGRLLEFTESGNMWFDLEEGFVSSFEVNSQTKTELPYREKRIETRIDNLMRMTIRKK